MKKVIFILITILLILLMFIGCSNNESISNTVSSDLTDNATNSTSSTNINSSMTNTEKISDVAQEIEKILNDLQLSNDNESITEEDVENDINSRLDEFSTILNTDIDSIN